MGRGRDMDEIGQVGGRGWDAGEVGGMWVGGTRARRGRDMGEVGEVGGLCGLCGEA